MEFVVTKTPLPDGRHPAIGVDGPVEGADLVFDHHATGERVNLEAIPDEIPAPAVVATTMLDSDAVISAAVVLLRAAGEHAAVNAVLPLLYEAAHYCDHLIPSGQHSAAERDGLGLHCWLKEHGFALSDVRGWANGELSKDDKGRLRPRPSPAAHGWVFGELTRALVEAIRRGALPCDFGYLDRLAGMEAEARRQIQRVDGCVTVSAFGEYVDPVVLYRVVDTDISMRVASMPAGAYRYEVGVHPRAYDRIDLRPLYGRLNEREPGWGGRANAGGSAIATGSRIPLPELVKLLNTDLVRRTAPPGGG